MSLKKEELALKRWLIPHLRRISYRWAPRSNAIKNARVGRNQYLCTSCEKIFPKKEIRIDHDQPVIGLDGFVDWNTYIPRLFCEEKNLKCLCLKCHNIKTSSERYERMGNMCD